MEGHLLAPNFLRMRSVSKDTYVSREENRIHLPTNFLERVLEYLKFSVAIHIIGLY